MQLKNVKIAKDSLSLLIFWFRNLMVLAGFIINSAEFRLELTEKKKLQIANLTNQFKIGSCYKIREVARVLGVLTAACPATAYGSIYCKRLERQKFLALLLNDNDYEGKIYINKAMSDDLLWWKENSQTGCNPIRILKFALEISSDASLTDWGAHCQGSSSQGFWNRHEKHYSINYLELLAAFFALKCFAPSLYNCEILLRMDNTSAISYINRTGGVQFPHLSELAKKIWQWCKSRKIWIFASYIPSKQNVEADAASRVTNIDTEWELAPEAFKKLNKEWGPFTIDLFASRSNRKCKRFYSRYPQPDAEVTMVTPAGVKTFIGGRELIRMAFLKKGINEDSVDIMINSITVSTLKQYQAHLKLWWDFASVNSINMFQADTPAIISFLTKRFKEGASYGIFKQKPTKPKYSSIWDTAPVLNYLENINPLNQFKAKEVAEKTATLLALATAHRLQTLALIKTDNILISSTGITIKIPDLIKTSKL
ncbi:uncharacterized protein LOC115233212, partial [Formica exsecta]|uniref:uncharacterized protein LOC115233212 n=1 Tax=Formica exsecta TaxID=72781 RepID=UPI001142424F